MQRATRIIQRIQNAIFNPVFIEQHRRDPTAFTRIRKLSFAIIMATLLHMARRSLQIECNILGDLLQMDEPASKQAFSKARYKISYTGFKALNQELLEEFYVDNDEGLWKGYRILGIDGSTIRLPDTPETDVFFGRCSGSEQEDKKFPVMARISEIVDLTAGIVVNAEIGPYGFSEDQLADEQIPEVVKFFREQGQEKILMVFDRGYPSKKRIQMLVDLEVDFIFRMPRDFNRSVTKALKTGKQDSMIHFADNLPELRLLRKTFSSNEEGILLTSLTDSKEFCAESVFAAYWLRWSGCEEGYKKQKIALEMENFSGKTVEAVLQEFWATMLYMNVFLAHCVDEEGFTIPEVTPVKRINRSVLFGSLKEDLRKVVLGETSAKEFSKKFNRLAKRSQVKVRPDRQFSRKGVGKPTLHHAPRRVC